MRKKRLPDQPLGIETGAGRVGGDGDIRQAVRRGVGLTMVLPMELDSWQGPEAPRCSSRKEREVGEECPSFSGLEGLNGWRSVEELRALRTQYDRI